MRKKTSPTIDEQVIIMVPEFTYVIKKLKQQVKLKVQSESTFSNYVRQIAIFVLHFQ